MGPPPEFIDGCRVLAYANVPDSVPFTGRLRLNVDGRWLGRVPNLAVGIADAGEFVVLHCDAGWESLGIGGWNAPGVVEPAVGRCRDRNHGAVLRGTRSVLDPVRRDRVLMRRWVARIGLALSLSLATAACLAADIPCAACPVPQRPVRPESGYWHDPMQPGTGFSIEVQRDTVAGAYFGYTPLGQPEWFTFAGPLQRGSAADSWLWSLDVRLQRASDGSCLGCSYTAPHVQPAAPLRIEFLQRSLARFRIADGPWVWMQPLIYGVPAFAEFGPQVGFSVPDLVGEWVLVFFNPRALHTASPARRAYTVNFVGDGDPLDARAGSVGYLVFGPPSIASDTPLGAFECSLGADSSPVCNYTALGGYSHDPAAPQKAFVLPLGNVSDARFEGEAADGETVEAFRLDHD